MFYILYAKVTRFKETYFDERTSNERSHSTTVGTKINSAHEKHLPVPYLNDYSVPVAQHWATGRGNPCNTEATIDALSVFFVVHANVSASFHLAANARASMVSQTGQPSGWPVSSVAGISTPVWATTHGRGNSSGSNIRYTEEVDDMSSAPTRTRTKFIDIYWIAALNSDNPYGKTSFTRQEARLFRAMFKDSRLIWAGRKPVHEGVKEISIPQSGVNITPPVTITEIFTVQRVAHV